MGHLTQTAVAALIATLCSVSACTTGPTKSTLDKIASCARTSVEGASVDLLRECKKAYGVDDSVDVAVPISPHPRHTAHQAPTGRSSFNNRVMACAKTASSDPVLRQQLLEECKATIRERLLAEEEAPPSTSNQAQYYLAGPGYADEMIRAQIWASEMAMQQMPWGPMPSVTAPPHTASGSFDFPSSNMHMYTFPGRTVSCFEWSTMTSCY